MKQRASWGLIGRIRFVFRNRPVVAAAVTALSLLIVGSAITFTTPLRCGPAKAFGLKSIAAGCVTVGSVAISSTPTPFPGKGNPNPFPPLGNPASNPYFNPASGPYPGNQASGPYPPQSNGASGPGGPYPPFYAPASNGSAQTVWPLDCRLPVYAGQPGSGGFIVYPGGSFIPDQSSSVTLPATSPSPTPVAGPGPGYGYYASLSYDRQFSRWLPVGVNQVSPDGSHYAFAGTNGIYVVEVATGKMSELGEGHPWTIVAVQSDSVDAGDPGTGGLWVVPFSGTARQVTKTGYWKTASKTAAYGTATSAVPQGASNVLQRLDLATGVAVDWFSRPGSQSSLTGLDGKGNPIITVSYLNNSGSEIWIATGATSATAIAGSGSPQFGGGGFSSFTTPVVDSHGIWFTGSYNGGFGGGFANGIALYVPNQGFYWMSGYGAQLAGGCY